MPAAAQLDTTSDIDELEQITRQATIRVNTRSRRGNPLFGWSIPPNLERSWVAREKIFLAKEASKPETPAPIIHIFAGANVISYAELISVIRSRVGALGVRYQDFDVLAGWAAGLSGKVFGPCEAKRLGPEKLFDAIRAAGLRIRVEEDAEQTAKMSYRIAERFNPRQANQARTNNRNYPPSEQLIDRVLAHLANSKGGIALLHRTAREARSNKARRAYATRRENAAPGMPQCL
jgi:hypothetical protein